MSDKIEAKSVYKMERKAGYIPSYTKAILRVLDKEEWCTALKVTQKIEHIITGSHPELTTEVIQNLLHEQFANLRLIEDFEYLVESPKGKITKKIVYKATEHTHPMLEIATLEKEMVFIIKIIYETSRNNGNYSTIETINTGLKGYTLKNGTIPEYINQLMLTGILDPYQDGMRINPEYWKYLDIIFKNMRK